MIERKGFRFAEDGFVLDRFQGLPEPAPGTIPILKPGDPLPDAARIVAKIRQDVAEATAVHAFLQLLEMTKR